MGGPRGPPKTPAKQAPLGTPFRGVPQGDRGVRPSAVVPMSPPEDNHPLRGSDQGCGPRYRSGLVGGLVVATTSPTIYPMHPHATIVSTDDHSVMSTITQRCRRRDGCHPSRRISCPVLRSSIRHRVRHASLMGSMIRCAQSLWLVVASGGIATRVAHPERDGPTGSGTPCGWGPSPVPRRGFGPTGGGAPAPPQPGRGHPWDGLRHIRRSPIWGPPDRGSDGDDLGPPVPPGRPGAPLERDPQDPRKCPKNGHFWGLAAYSPGGVGGLRPLT